MGSRMLAYLIKKSERGKASIQRTKVCRLFVLRYDEPESARGTWYRFPSLDVGLALRKTLISSPQRGQRGNWSLWTQRKGTSAGTVEPQCRHRMRRRSRRRWGSPLAWTERRLDAGWERAVQDDRQGVKVAIADFEAHIRNRINESKRVKEGLLEGGHIRLIARVAEWIIEIYVKRGKILLFGNGGSAADAQHIAAELGGKYYMDRPPLPALALHANTSLLTAIGNDSSFTQVFARQVQALARTGDLAIGISTSGNSENVMEGIKAARANDIKTVGLTGASGGRLKELVNCCICVPSTDTPRIQETHILIGHIICELVEHQLFSRADARNQTGEN